MSISVICQFYRLVNRGSESIEDLTKHTSSKGANVGLMHLPDSTIISCLVKEPSRRKKKRADVGHTNATWKGPYLNGPHRETLQALNSPRTHTFSYLFLSSFLARVIMAGVSEGYWLGRWQRERCCLQTGHSKAPRRWQAVEVM